MNRHLWAEIGLFMVTIIISGGQSYMNNSTESLCSGLDDCYNQGMVLLSQGNCSEAYDALQRAVTYNQTNSNAWVGKGRAAACMNNFTEAIKCCEAAMVWDKENVQAYVVKAESLIAQNKSDEARAMMEDAIEKSISKPELWIECGKVFSRMEMWQDAQKCFNRATDINRDNVEGWYLEANALQRLGQFRDAILVYNQSVSVDPQNVDAWLGRSQTLAELRLYSEAEKSYSKVLDLDPTNKEALLKKGMMLLLLRRNEEAAKVLTNLTELDPNNATAWMNVGLALAKIGEFNESLTAYDNAISLDRNNTEAWMGRGDAQLNQGLINQSQETYEFIIKMDPHNGLALERMACVLNRNGNCRAALTYAEQSFRDDMIPQANYARSWFTYANALNATHQHDKAIEQYQNALEKVQTTSPLDPEIDLRDIEWARECAYIHRADHEYSNNLILNRSDYAHARYYFENLVEENESDTNAWVMLGICNLKLWQFDRAEDCFNQVLKVDPTNLTAAELMAWVDDERRPHIIGFDFSNEGIDFESFDITKLFSWEPPENFQVELENMADVDGVAEVTIWTVTNSHVKQVRLNTFEVPVTKNSQTKYHEKVSIPRSAFKDWPQDLIGVYNFFDDINPVQLTFEVTVKETTQ